MRSLDASWFARRYAARVRPRGNFRGIARFFSTYGGFTGVWGQLSTGGSGSTEGGPHIGVTLTHWCDHFIDYFELSMLLVLWSTLLCSRAFSLLRNLYNINVVFDILDRGTLLMVKAIVALSSRTAKLGTYEPLDGIIYTASVSFLGDHVFLFLFLRGGGWYWGFLSGALAYAGWGLVGYAPFYNPY